MHRIDDSLYLLYIEPKKEEKSAEPIDDILTYAMEIALKISIEGHSEYYDLKSNGRFYPYSWFNGFHMTDCGEMGGGNDYLLLDGHITNKLASFYLKWYRNSIPDSELSKLGDLLFYIRHSIPMICRKIGGRDLKYDIHEFKNEIIKLRGYFH